jgi:hypothetical protein
VWDPETEPGGNPFPHTSPTSAEARKTAKFTLPMAVASWGSDFTPATVQQWNFNLQRGFFGSYVVTAAWSTFYWPSSRTAFLVSSSKPYLR